MDTHVDVAVLGAGPGGYVAAIRAAQLGLRVAVVEQQWWGGVCLNVGCIPTKSLLRNAELAEIVLRHADEFGIAGDITVDYAKAFTRSRAVSERMAKGVRFLMKKNNIVQIEGRGVFRDAHTLVVDGKDAQTLTFDHAIVATGASPKMLPGIVAGPRVLTYRELILSEQLPSSIIIAGSGPIGVEFAFVLASYGVDVCVVEFLDRMVPGEDTEISAELAKRYAKLGVEVLTSTKVCAAVEDADGVTVNLEPVGGGEGLQRRADALLVAVGFAPNSAGLGLEDVGVALGAGGSISVDDTMRTNVPDIYAIGDVTAKAMLAHTASMQGVIAAETIAGHTTIPIDYRMIPHATYCQPQVASFGLTEAQAREQGLDVRVSKFPFLANGKAVGLGEPTGFVKIVADAAHGEILGAHMIGPDVTELLPELTLAQLWDLTADEVARNIHAHPTLSEAVKEACEGINGQMIDV